MGAEPEPNIQCLKEFNRSISGMEDENEETSNYTGPDLKSLGLQTPDC